MDRELHESQQFLLVHVDRWVNDRFHDGLVMIGDRAVIDGRIFKPIACISLTDVHNPKSCHYVFQCRRGTEGFWFEIENDKKPRRINQPMDASIVLFTLYDYE